MITPKEKKYPELVVLDGREPDFGIIYKYNLTKHPVENRIKPFNEDGIIGYELSDAIYWKIFNYKKKVLLIPLIGYTKEGPQT